jgi:hypothetical protein
MEDISNNIITQNNTNLQNSMSGSMGGSMGLVIAMINNPI